MPQPVRAFTDNAGDAWLVMDNGQRIQLPVSGTGGNGVDTTADRWVDVVGDTMTGPLIQATNTSAGDKQAIEVRSPAYPALMLNKTNAPVDQHLWKMYASGAAGAANALTFLPMADNPLAAVPAIRMQRDGRITLGAGPAGALDAATKSYVDEGLTASAIASGNTTSAARFTRSGRLVAFDGRFTLNTSGALAENANYFLGYVPAAEFCPLASLWFPCLFSPNLSTTMAKPVAVLNVTTGGSINMKPTQAVTLLAGSAEVYFGVAYQGGALTGRGVDP
jgi:hypothetical protein